MPLSSDAVIRSLIDTIPLSILFIDSVILKDHNYLETIIEGLNRNNQREKIKELCNGVNIENPIRDQCPIFKNIDTSCEAKISNIDNKYIKNNKFNITETTDFVKLIDLDSIKPPKFGVKDIKEPSIISDRWINDKIEAYKLSQKITNILNSASNRNSAEGDIKKSRIFRIKLASNNYLNKSPIHMITKKSFEPNDNTLPLLDLQTNLNKLLACRNIILYEEDLAKINQDETLTLVRLFKHRKNQGLVEPSFKPMQLNRILLEKMFPNAFINGRNINPVWRYIYDNGISRISQVQYIEAIAVQCATFALLFFLDSHLPPIYFQIFLLATATLFGIAKIAQTQCPVHEWYKLELNGIPARNLLLVLFWSLAFLVSTFLNTSTMH